MRIYIYTFVNIYIYTFVCIYINVYVCTVYIYVYIYTHHDLHDATCYLKTV